MATSSSRPANRKPPNNKPHTPSVAAPNTFRIVPLPTCVSPSSTTTTTTTTSTTIFCSNKVITSKYTMWSFLPKFLLESFRKLANIYFLFVACLQCVPYVSDTQNVPTTLPVLLFILTVDGVLAVLQDLRRHRADHEANGTICHIVSLDPRSRSSAEDDHLTSISWAQVTVGSIVKLHKHETAPADLLILAVHEPDPVTPSGVCYVESKSLDGETNLKQRQAVSVTLKAQTADQLLKVHGFLRCEQPNRVIGRFDGTLCVDSEASSLLSVFTRPQQQQQHQHHVQQESTTKQVGVSIQNMILRGCQLRNTKWVYGLVVNTGHDTKIMQSASSTPAKWSSMNKIVNRMIRWLLLLLILFCSTAASAELVWIHHHPQESQYLGLHETSMVVLWFENVGSYFLLMYQMIPVSLYVTMSMVMLFQAIFMGMDLDMYDPASDTCAVVRTLELNEELGQVSHVFSDKTGTLTCNVMEFRKCSIHGRIYGRGTTEIGRVVMQRKGLAVPTEVDAQSGSGLEFCSPEDAGPDDSTSNGSIAALIKASPSKVGPVSSAKRKIPFVNFDDPLLDSMVAKVPPLNRKNTTPRAQSDGTTTQPSPPPIHLTKEAEFFLLLSLCHTVIPEKSSTGTLQYSASSPDEQVLVCAAKYFGFCFESRTLDKVKIRVTNRSCLFDPTQEFEIWEFEILEVLEFTSDRKRMSVIVSFPDTTKWILTKGAECVVFPLLAIPTPAPKPESSSSSPSDSRDLASETMEHLVRFAEEGLRTLTIACRQLTDNEYADWSLRFHQVVGSLEEMEKKKLGLPNEIDRCISQIETNLTLLGVTAIEDKLQQHVPRTIMMLLRAGIKVWMLTGDQQVTAINISYACQLLTDSMHQLVFSLDRFGTREQIQQEILMAKERILQRIATTSSSSPPSPRQQQQEALIIDGDCLDVVLANTPNTPKLRQEFFELASHCCTVICCRVTPSQKAELVALIREFIPQATTLAIGDGANDVAMIQRAHVGVGISASHEGLQAVNASDYAIGQFCFLEKLLLHHGRLNYKRMACLVGYMFYKNILMVLVEFLYLLYTGSSTSKIYCEGFFQLYNVCYTSAPILYLGTFDTDLQWRHARNYPELYRVGVHKQLFDGKKFFGKWILSACLEAAAIVAFVLAGYNDANRVNPLASATREEVGLLAFALVVLVANCKLWFVQMSWTTLGCALWIATIVCFLPVSTWMVSHLQAFFPSEYGSFEYVAQTLVFWLVLLLGTFSILLRDYVVIAFQRRFAPLAWQILQEIPLAKRTSTIGVGELSTRPPLAPDQAQETGEYSSPMSSDLVAPVSASASSAFSSVLNPLAAATRHITKAGIATAPEPERAVLCRSPSASNSGPSWCAIRTTDQGPDHSQGQVPGPPRATGDPST